MSAADHWPSAEIVDDMMGYRCSCGQEWPFITPDIQTLWGAHVDAERDAARADAERLAAVVRDTFDEANTFVKMPQGYRKCRACARERWRRRAA